jgi:hypothetical protein
VLTAVIGFFVVVTCAATRAVHVNSATDAAVAPRTDGGIVRALAFRMGIIEAAIFASAVLRLSAAHSLSKSRGRRVHYMTGSAVWRSCRLLPVIIGLIASRLAALAVLTAR